MKSNGVGLEFLSYDMPSCWGVPCLLMLMLMLGGIERDKDGTVL